MLNKRLRSPITIKINLSIKLKFKRLVNKEQKKGKADQALALFCFLKDTNLYFCFIKVPIIFMKKANIIGAGVAGIAVAIRLAVKGFEVSVFEANDYAGGKLTAFHQEGYRFDAGPSLFTLPQLVNDLFILAGRHPKEYFQYQKLETICHYFYEDGTRIKGYADTEKFAQELETQTGVEKAKVLKHLKKSAELYDLTASIFLEQSLHKRSTFFQFSTFKAALQLHKLNALESMANYNQRFFKNEQVAQLFNRFATYNGSDPYQAPATLNIIPHLEHNMGAYFPNGGMHSITQSLLQLAKELGVKFHFNHKVEEIVIEKNKVKGIKVNDELRPSEIVVSNMDIFHTYQKLMPHIKAPEKILNQEKSSSGLIFYWGMKLKTKELGLHNIFFSQNYKEEFEHIFKLKKAYDDPTIYVHISSKYEASDAPADGENWFVMINVPNNTGQDWGTIINQSRQQIIKKLSRILGRDIADFIVCESILDPRSIESKTSSHLGALYGNSSNNRMAAFFRHANFSSTIENLYFCGGSVHPGGGIPLCLSSAKIVGEMVEQ